MTISTSSSAPLFAAVGCTGTLGGSVITALQSSSTPYRVRGICRDASKPAAQSLSSAGIEVLSADVYTSEGAQKAFKDADIVFASTYTDYSLPSPDAVKEAEITAGKTQMDAAKEVGVRTVVWHGLSNHGKHSKTGHELKIFDSKAAVTDYGRSLNTFKLIDVQPGGFASNYWTNGAPRPIGDDVFAMFVPFSGDTLISICDMDEDYGRYVVAAVEQKAGDGLETVYTGQYVRYSELASALAKVSGKNVQVIETSAEQFQQNLAGAAGPTLAKCLTEMYVGIDKNGYYCGADVEPSLRLVGGIRSFEEALEANREKLMNVFR